MNRLLIGIFLILFFGSCSEYQKALKSEDIALKYASAEKMYEKEKYNKAIRLFEQIAPSYKGKPQAEKMFYMYAKALYNSKQYYLAGYQFESFTASYPKSEKIEETAFLGPKCYSLLSPRYSLDQIDTERAIDKLQKFIDTYPNSDRLADANLLVKELREKLEKKAFEIAKQYNTISDHKAAIVVLDNFISDYPGTPFKEAALFYKYDSSYKLAINSINSKMEDRLVAAKEAYNKLITFKSDTKYKQQADEMLARINTDIQQFSK